MLDQIPGREKEPGKLPDSFKIHLLKTVVKLQRLMAGSCDNVILLFLGQAHELFRFTLCLLFHTIHKRLFVYL